jgi:hypothetical protein
MWSQGNWQALSGGSSPRIPHEGKFGSTKHNFIILEGSLPDAIGTTCDDSAA